MTMTLHAKCRCPECKAPINAATSIESGDTPRPGDLSLCTACGAALTFFVTPTEHELHVRRLTPEEWRGLPLNTRADLVQARRSLTLRTILVVDWRHT